MNCKQALSKALLNSPTATRTKGALWALCIRTPSPLSTLDPGIDAYTGNSIFLEGHRQNSAMFADSRQGTALTKLGSLTPAFIVQTLAPLLLILLVISAISRERESQRYLICYRKVHRAQHSFQVKGLR